MNKIDFLFTKIETYKMPESAEVKLTTEFLNDMLEGRIVVDWKMTSGQYISKDPKGYEEFMSNLPLMVEQVYCKGKQIYFILFNEYRRWFVIHSLRMTGRWQFDRDQYCRWYIEIDNGRKLWFRNPRCLATLYFTDSETVFRESINKLGPDILTDKFNLEIWNKLRRVHANKNITRFLMSQDIISGCGNYIKAEALYYAKISPMRKVGSLTDNEASQLFEALRVIPRTAYVHKGVSIRDYADAEGKKGFHEFHLKIYGKKNAKKTKTADGRTTYWDPKLQK